MQHDLIDQYNSIINLLDQAENNIAGSYKPPEQTIFELHKIAIDMFNFKKAGGSLRHDYGYGILIQRFFENIFSTNSDLEEWRQNSLIELDKKIANDAQEIKPYQLLEEECNLFLVDNPNGIEPRKETTNGLLLENARKSLNHSSIHLTGNSHSKRLEFERIEFETKKKTGYCAII